MTDLQKAGIPAAALTSEADGQDHDRHTHSPAPREVANGDTVTIRTKQKKPGRMSGKDAQPPKQKLGQCERCGYLSSQAVCKACVLLEGLNKARPKTGIAVGGEGG